jgi:AcrR family transcriptional regulator
VEFQRVLAAQARQSRLRKGERTRLRLLAATAAELQRCHVHTLRVTDIAAGAGVAAGTFYLYFRDRGEAAEAMLDAFARHVFEALEAAALPGDGLEASVHATTRAYVHRFAANPGLFRALMQMTETSARFEAIYRELNARWNRRTAAAIARRRGRAAPSEAELLTAYALGGMVDEFLANLYVRRDPTLEARIDSPDEAAEVLAATWLQAVVRGA